MTAEKRSADFISAIKHATLDELHHWQSLVAAEIKKKEAPPKKSKRIITFTDGASRGNPGHAGIGVLLFDENDEKILQDYRYIGQCTNNEAEYRALLLALDRALEITHGDVNCYMDSELLVRQMNGQYAVRSEKMMQFHQEVKNRVAKFHSVSFTHVPREHPTLRLVDKLANKAIDEAMPKK